MQSLRGIAKQLEMKRGSLGQTTAQPLNMSSSKVYASDGGSFINRYTPQSTVLPFDNTSFRQPLEARRATGNTFGILSERHQFRSSELTRQIQDFRRKLFEMMLYAGIFLIATTAFLLLYFPLRMILEGTFIAAFLLYFKIGARLLHHWLYHAALLLLFLVYLTDMTNKQRSLSALGSLSFCLPMALLIYFVKWKQLSQVQSRRSPQSMSILYAIYQALKATLKDLFRWNNVKLFLATIAIGLIIGELTHLLRFSNITQKYFGLLIAGYVSLILIINLTNELDFWVDLERPEFLQLNHDMPLAFWMLRLDEDEYRTDQHRAVKHILRLLRKQKNIMHQEIGRNGFGQKNYWEVFVRHFLYKLTRVEGILADYRSQILNCNLVLESYKPLLVDIFIPFRKLYAYIKKWIVTIQIQEILLSLTPVYEILVKSLSNSRTNTEREVLEEPSSLFNKVRSLFETGHLCWEDRKDSKLEEFLRLSLQILAFLDSRDFDLSHYKRMLRGGKAKRF